MNRGSEKCIDCGTPLIERVNSREYAIINNRRQKIPIDHNGDTFRVGCPKCGKMAIFSTTRIDKGLTYVVTTELEKK